MKGMTKRVKNPTRASKKMLVKAEKMAIRADSYRDSMYGLSDDALKEKTIEFKNRLASGQTLEKLLPEAFAVVREASRRVLGMEPYLVQLTGGALLFYGCIAEMCTGEGKTLVAALPSYLMALTGKGVHVVTVNDYLVQRDALEIGKVHQFLGLSVGYVLQSCTAYERKEAYSCDITYVTNSELGFDYLRDNMCQSLDKQVQRGLHFVIIDEADSGLIDESRTPLIISGEGKDAIGFYKMADAAVKSLVRGKSTDMTKLEAMNGVGLQESGDFIVDEKDKLIHLTDAGANKIEKILSIKNYASPEHADLQHYIQMALRANHIMHKDKDYVVSNDEVLIVDEFTGRIMPGRRYSDGLHQAIEAKEHVTIQQETKTVASITYQKFFNLYEKKCGMTGTAMTEAEEFKEIYGMLVVAVPTNKPIRRIDAEDKVYLTKKAKYEAVVDAVKKAHEKGQPVLVGTASIDVSELLSEMFQKQGIEHQVLNAKEHEHEAEIISHAGEYGMVTIATNMAGRGTDIKLENRSKGAGGLLVIGTERHESRRIDNQLRGRSGRQGDMGKSQFYLSLEDDVLRLFGSDRLLEQFKSLDMNESEPIQHRMLTKSIERAQKSIEGNNYGIRKHLLDYDEVNHQQRMWVYSMRNNILKSDHVWDYIMDQLSMFVDHVVDVCFSTKRTNDWDIECADALIREIIPSGIIFVIDKKDTKKSMRNKLYKIFRKIYKEKEHELGFNVIRDLERTILLSVIDRCWMQQLEDLDQLQQSIGFLGYGQKDPVIVYKKEAYELFRNMQLEIATTVLQLLYHAHIVSDEKTEINDEEHEILESIPVNTGTDTNIVMQKRQL